MKDQKLGLATVPSSRPQYCAATGITLVLIGGGLVPLFGYPTTMSLPPYSKRATELPVIETSTFGGEDMRTLA